MAASSAMQQLRALFLALLAIVGPLILAAQVAADGSNSAYRPVQLFDRVDASPATDRLWNKAVDKATVLKLSEARELRDARSPHQAIRLALPMEGSTLILELERAEVAKGDLTVRVASTGEAVPYVGGAHFRGRIVGVPGTVAAVSIFEDHVMAVIGDAQGQWVLGPFEEAPQGYHVLYRDTRLRTEPGLSCTVPREAPSGQPNDEEMSTERTIRCVSNYFEVAYDIHQNKGGVTGAANYITGLFNQVAVLFANDGIDMTLSEVFVWDVPSPFNGSTSGDRLDQFGQVRTSFNGDLGHLVDLANLGGVAWLNTLCNSQPRFRMAYSGVNANYSNVPTYSWSVNVVAHEAGHNLGSRHTHACAWNGNNTAIDGCGQAAGYPEGTCPQGPLPTSAVGGTVMSYCHLTSSGIRFANGFGPQPAALMQNRVNSSACLQVCGSTCDAPGTLFVTGLGVEQATLNWSTTGASAYDVDWKAQASGTWTSVSDVSGTSLPLTGLTQGTAYEFRVRSVCGAESSAWSSIQTFTTPVPCPDALEPNNSLAAAADITVPTTVSALIASSADVDYYRFTLSTASSLSISLSNLAGDYDIRLLSSTGTQLAISQFGGTSSEFIGYEAAAGTYVLHVYGWNGAFSAVQCYQLNVNAFPTAGCEPPDGLSAVNVTWDEATLQWPVVEGATAYDVEWRAVGETEWAGNSGVPATELLLTGLSWETTYEAQVRSRCPAQGAQGTTFSDYTETITFTTLAPPCEVFAPSGMLLEVYLDGPYDPLSGLMRDDLRAQGLLPLTEPYSAMGHVLEGATAMDPAYLNETGPLAVVDWVLVQLRDPVDPSLVIAERAGLLLRNGRVVRPDMQSMLLAFCAPQGSYHVAVLHRNHLGAMTAAPVPLAPLGVPIVFHDPGFAAWGAEAQRSRSGRQLLWPGNSLVDALVKYTGEDNDRDVILGAVGGVVPTQVLPGYHVEDLNLDGQVKYTGADNDRDLILNAIGGVVPTAVRVGQMP